MRLLLGSGGFRTEERKAIYRDRMRTHFGDIERILFVPWALHDHDRYVQLMHEKGLDAGYVLEGIHTFEDPVAAVESCEGIYIGGGNTFVLLDVSSFTLGNLLLLFIPAFTLCSVARTGGPRTRSSSRVVRNTFIWISTPPAASGHRFGSGFDIS